jgi:hypothetical protein
MDYQDGDVANATSWWSRATRGIVGTVMQPSRIGLVLRGAEKLRIHTPSAQRTKEVGCTSNVLHNHALQPGTETTRGQSAMSVGWEEYQRDPAQNVNVFARSTWQRTRETSGEENKTEVHRCVER